MYDRKATSIEEQVELLISRGLEIEDVEFARNALLQVGYFRFKGYCLPYYKENDVFHENAQFEDIYLNYRFDERLRLLLFQIVEHIEVELKSVISYHFALEYGSLGHYNVINFKNEHYYSKWRNDFDKTVMQASKRKELYPTHYIEKYENTFPIWVALEMTSFGSLSQFYSNLHNDMQNKISKDIYGVHKDYFANWLYSLSIVRNMCAHTSRIYDKVLPIKLKLPGKEIEQFDNDRVFAHIFACKKICLDVEYYNRFFENLKYLTKKYKNYIDLDKIGFPVNWKNILADESNVPKKSYKSNYRF